MESRQMTYGLGSRRPWAVFGVLVPLCVLALVGLGQLWAAAEPEPTEALRAQAARDGQVQVEVRLPDAAATDPAGRQEDLDRAAGDVLFALPDGSYQALPRVTGSASLDLRVDAAGLDALLASPLVAGVSAGQCRDAADCRRGEAQPQSSRTVACGPGGATGKASSATARRRTA